LREAMMLGTGGGTGPDRAPSVKPRRTRCSTSRRSFTRSRNVASSISRKRAARSPTVRAKAASALMRSSRMAASVASQIISSSRIRSWLARMAPSSAPSSLLIRSLSSRICSRARSTATRKRSISCGTSLTATARRRGTMVARRMVWMGPSA
jgi:hypothetical protein